ncbi:MAG: excinuclease ABC subunit UvrA [Alphaproteobacteria bacterium]|nr:excinuclease ABC subunit UvrA [Alphaproteobacteria bacterium]
MNKFISVKGAKEHNLKNVSIDIPKNTITVITGLSGSGKSSLAFDTIYAEGQRRYVESLSAYARQFLDTFDKPDVESIEGLSPAISIEQKTTSKNPRSTVGTITEIYDYLRLLYARVGIPYSPATGLPIEKQTISMMVDKLILMTSGTKINLLAPIVRGRKGEFKREFDDLRKKGFQRLKIDNNIYEIDEIPTLDKNIKHDIAVIVDRIIIKEGIEKRLSQSLETALSLSEGIVIAENIETNEETLFSEKFACPVSGFAIEEIEPRLFSFNNPFGACETCKGLGVESIFELSLIIPDQTKPLIDAIAPWNNQLGGYYKAILEGVAKHYKINSNTPFIALPEKFKQIVLYGSGSENIKISFVSNNHTHTSNRPFEGVMPSLERRYKDTESESSRENLSSYLIEKPCHSCSGKRLNEKALQIKIDMKNIYDVSEMSVENCFAWVSELDSKLSENHKKISEKVVKEIRDRLSFLNNVGIGYLNLSRSAGTLSGGESQRIRLASQIGSGLTGVLYVLDEPSIGLHQRDNDKLLETLQHLKNLDNTVIVVEHDEDTIRFSDFLIDMGPRAGVLGGEIVASGTPIEVENNPNSITGKYLRGDLKIEIPKKRRKGNGNFIKLLNAHGNNLKNVSVDFPLGLMTCVTGVSGSGKSTLINETLYKAVSQHIYNSKDDPAPYDNVLGLENIDKVIDIDQSPIGRMPSSNPATYTKTFDVIRELFAELPEAKARGYKGGRFSFNVKGGRCEICKGDGVIKIEMHFLPDVYIKCEECKGKRYNRETLEIKWNDKSIADVLDMTVSEGCEFFSGISTIANKLNALNEVGLGYIKLGQSATTFSGGEAQRIKLAKELSKKSTGKTLYILDEPTTGLHFDDVNKLIQVLQQLVDQGNTAIIIEHNLDVIKVADYIIDVGPEGGVKGGQIIAKGTPEEVTKVESSFTGKYLKKLLVK